VIYGIGTDIVGIQRIAGNLQRYGERFAQRILTDDEIAQFRTSARQAHFLAKRFAAKEATAKALGTGFRDGLSLRDIGVRNNELGKPELDFSAKAQQWLQSRSIEASHLSLSDEQDFAIAFVTLECAEIHRNTPL
jgi:holo-[acyl-carrier protein] synthase